MDTKPVDKNNKHSTRLTVLIVLVTAALVVSILVPAAIGFTQSYDAKLVLLYAKAVRLAVRNVTASCYAENRIMADQTDEFGFSEGVREEIEELAACPGSVYLVQWDAVNFAVKRFAYIDGDYIATCQIDEDGSMIWDVFMIDPAL